MQDNALQETRKFDFELCHYACVATIFNAIASFTALVYLFFIYF